MKVFSVLSRWFSLNQAPNIHRPKSVFAWRWASIVLCLSAGLSAFAQAPSLSWTNNVNGRLFAVDSSDNVYANTTNGAVVELNSSGVVVQSNVLTHLPGLAQRDSLGNFYLSGSIDGTNDFGGTTIVGGWFDTVDSPKPTYVPGWPTVYLAKYSSAGSLLWVTNFGVLSARNFASDLVVNSDDTVTLSYGSSTAKTFLAQFSATGLLQWQANLSVNGNLFGLSTVRLATTTGTNGLLLVYSFQLNITEFTFDSSGAVSNISAGPPFWYDGPPLSPSLYGKPVLGTNETALVPGLSGPNLSSQPILNVWQNGTLLATTNLAGDEPWPLAGDASGDVFLSCLSGIFSKYDGSAHLIWSTNYGSSVDVLLFDSAGNGFVSLDNGTVARLASPATPLALKVTGSALVFTWPATASNMALQVSTSLNGGWTNVSMPTKIVGGQCVVSNTMTAPAAFYRLK